MSSNFRLFKRQLDEALELVDATLGAKGKESFKPPETADAFPAAQSLLSRCESVCKKYEKDRPTIRIIHHLACSGGSLISKCISALPNVFLLSEVHPFTTQHMGGKIPKFWPSDLTTVGRYAGIPKIDEFASKQFLSSIKLITQHVNQYGGTVVLRDHSHSDFCLEPYPRKNGGVVSVLQEDFEVDSVITLRDPIDCYLSLSQNYWLHFSPATFDEYCRRVLGFLDSYAEVNVLKYEDFVASPKIIIKSICDEIDLPYNDSFEDIFDAFKVTGDSGRAGATICQRERRNMNENLRSEIKKSKNYPLIAERFGYEPI